MRRLSIVVLALSGCAAPPPDLRKELDELALVRAELQASMDEIATQLRKLREQSSPPPAPAPAVASALGSRVMASANNLSWVLLSVTFKGEPRTVVALYRASGERGFALDGVRLVEEDVAKALK